MRSMKLQEIPSNGSRGTALKVLCSLSKVLLISDLSQPNRVCVDSGVKKIPSSESKIQLKRHNQ